MNWGRTDSLMWMRSIVRFNILFVGISIFFGLILIASTASAADGVYVRFRMVEPADTAWHVKLGCFVHVEPWTLPGAVLPSEAAKDLKARFVSGQFTPWFDLRAYAGVKLHGQQNRAGGIAECPNVTVDFISDVPSPGRKVVIELATGPDEGAVVKRFEESFVGSVTSFTVSPDLEKDAGRLETAAQMTARRLAWARQASGGQRISPKQLIVQTSFWSPQRPELNVQEGEVLSLLGFNVVGDQMPEVREKWHFTDPGGNHDVDFGPGLTREDVERQIAEPAKRARAAERDTLFNFSDEIACRPPIGKNAKALAQFRQWLKEKNIDPKSLGAASIDEVIPIESPADLRARQKADLGAANRTFVYTIRFRQQSATQRIKWLTESFHQHAPPRVLTSTLVADHPYFGGSGLGMGMDRENTTWGGFPLSLDWFGLGREHVVDVIGIEDWLGLQYMYGPDSTWDGFQLLGFQAAMFRSASRGTLPIITWVTPSDEVNLRLKSASALCQGAKHLYYWTYGPTATSTENYWSDLRGAYDGIVAVTRQLAAAEHIIAPGKTRSTRVAMLYNLSSDLWQPFGYLPMAERRLTYFSLIHDQYLVDFLTERDVEEGRLKDYSVLYASEPNISTAACQGIRNWVEAGGHLYGACGVAGRDEFNQEVPGLADVFGIEPKPEVQVQPGRFDVRGGLNELPWLDQVTFASGDAGFGALGLKARVAPKNGRVIASFRDGRPAILQNQFGKGVALYVATCPGVSYAKDAGFVRDALKEKWPAAQRHFINRAASAVAPRLVQLSDSVVEAGVYDADAGTALVLANFTYEPIPRLTVALRVRAKPGHVRSVQSGALKFTIEPAQGDWPWLVKTELPLGVSDIVILEP